MKKNQRNKKKKSLSLRGEKGDLSIRELTFNQILIQEQHKFILRLINEFFIINRNLNQMDKTIRGVKQINSALERLENVLRNQGYEIIQMQGKIYNENLQVEANFIMNTEPLEKSQFIISRVIRPQVNFNGEVIQIANIEVTQQVII